MPTKTDHTTPVMLISESGLYKLIMRSDKPEAKAFQDWVTRDVLPAIRKDGGYVKGEEKVASGELSEDRQVKMAAAHCHQLTRTIGQRGRSKQGPEPV